MPSKLSPRAKVNYNGDNYFFAFYQKAHELRNMKFDLRIREHDGNVGYLFRALDHGGERIPHPRLEVSTISQLKSEIPKVRLIIRNGTEL